MGNVLNCGSKSYDEVLRLRQVSPSVEPRQAPAPEELQPMIPSRRSAQRDSNGCCSCVQRACCECFCSICVLLLLAVCMLGAFVISSQNIEVYGTKFTFFNYDFPLLGYLIAGRRDTVSLTKWYLDLAANGSMVGDGPGPNTKSYYSWQTVRGLLEDFAPRIRDGSMKRYNEFGMRIFRSSMFPETGTNALGLSSGDHAAVRPFLGRALDGARGARNDTSCDGSICWNGLWLQRHFRHRFSGLTVLSSSDLRWIITVVLHKVHLDLDLTEQEAKAFVEFQGKFLVAAQLDRNWLWELVFGKFPVSQRQAYVGSYKDAIQRKWPNEGWTEQPAKLAVVASAMMDSIALAGGLSVPTVLEYMLAILYMKGEPGASLRPLNVKDEVTLHNFMWETIRRFAPVAGVPRWITDDGGQTWHHQLPNLEMAMRDPAEFSDPLEFRLGRPGLNYYDQSKSVSWAEFAMVNGDVADPNSHGCAAKQLSLEIILSFVKEFVAVGPWRVDNDDITLNSYTSSGFTLTKATALPLTAASL